MGVVLMLMGVAFGFMYLQEDKSYTVFDEATAEMEILQYGKADAAAHGQWNFQTPATEIMEKIVDLHNDLFFFIIVVVLFVS